jgi:uncharacterized membrane protein
MVVWLLRLSLAALLLFGSDVLLWADIQTRPISEWLLHSVGYLILATLLLDVCVRYRIRDIYDGMAAVAIYALIAGLLITPQVSLADFPRTLVSRTLGGHNLGGAVGFGIFLVLTAGHLPRYRRVLIAGMAWTGFYWGTWMRWTPEFSPLFTQIVDLPTMLFYAVVPVALGLLFFLLAQQPKAPLTPADFQLSTVGGLFLLLALTLIFMIRVVQSTLNVAALGLTLALIGVCIGILWFRRNEKAPLLMSAHIPPTPLHPIWVLLSGIVFVGMTILGYALPLVGTPDYNQLFLMELGYVGVGFLWLPIVAGVIAMRGIDYQMRTRQLDA